MTDVERPASTASTARSLFAVAGCLVIVALLAGGLALAAGATTTASSTTISGTVTDVDTGEPIEGAGITVVKPDGTQETASTDADGSYSVTAEQNGEYTVTAETAAHDAQSDTVNVSDSDETADFALGTTPRYEFTLAAGDVYAIGFPGPLENESIDEIFDRTDFQGVVYAYDESAGEWQQVVLGTGASADALDAVVVVVDDQADDVDVSMTFNGTAGIDDGTPPDRQLDDGWNFVSPPQSNASEAFAEAEEILDQGASEPQSQQVDGEDDFGRHTFDGSDAPRVNPFKGYFVRTDGGATVTAEAYRGITSFQADDRLRLGTGSVTGTIVDSNNQSVENATVSIDGRSVETDAAGEFHVSVVDAGVRNLTVEADGFEPVDRAIGVRVGETETADVVLELGTINGTVVDAASGDAIENASVTVSSANETVTTPTDANGSYSVDVRGDDYEVTATADGFEARTTNVSLEPGQTAADVNFSLVEFGAINGTVTDTELEQDDGIENATVRAINETDDVTLQTTTVENGSYAFDEVPADREYVIQVIEADGYVVPSDNVSRTVAPGQNGTDVDFTLSPKNGTLGGVVTDSNTSEAVENVAVTIQSRNSTFSEELQTNARGEYLLSDVPPHETYDLTFDHVDYSTANRTATVGPGENVTEDVALDPFGYLRGTVLDGDGTAIEGATVNVTADGDVVGSAQTDQNGNYETDRVAANTDYEVTARMAEYTPVSKTKHFDEGENVEHFVLTENGTINGTVFDETLAEQSGDASIENATVTVVGVGTDFEASVDTDENGAYTIQDVPTEFEYDLNATHEDHFANATNVTVGPGENVTQDLPLEPHNATIDGAVLDNVTGEGIANATVVVESTETVLLEPVFQASTETDENGSYAVEVEPHAEYNISVDAPDHEDPPTRNVTVGAGESYRGGGATEEYRLDPLGGSIRGNVSDNKTADALVGVNVTVDRLDESGNVTESNVGNDTTASDGSYAVEDLSSHEDYRVRVHATDHVDDAVWNVSLDPNEEVVLNFSLDPKNASISGVLNDSTTGEPIDNATVEAFAVADQDIVRTATTDETGSYSIDHLPAHEDYRVLGIDEDYHEADPTDENQVAQVRVGANETVENVDVELDPLPGHIVGTVTDAELSGDADRDPAIANVTVNVYEAGDAPAVAEPVATGETDQAGEYRTSNVSAGAEYFVEFVAADHEDHVNTSDTFAMEANGTVERNASLEPLDGTIRGMVTDNKTGDPVDAIVGITSEDDEQHVRATGQTVEEGAGEYIFDGVNASKDWTINVSADGYEDDGATRYLEANGLVEQDFPLQPRDGVIQGTVTDQETGEPIANVTVVATDVDDGNELNDTTGSEGSYDLNVTSPATYNVSVSTPDHKDDNATVEVGSGETVTQDFPLVPLPAEVSGTVTSDTTGEPIGNVSVTIESSETASLGQPQFQATDETDAQGEYGFDSVDPHLNYTVSFEEPDYADETTAEFELGANESVVKSRSLEPLNGSISGQVTDNVTGDAIAGATVKATSSSDNISNAATTADDGTYTIADVPADRTYEVQVTEATDYNTSSDADTTTVEPNEDVIGVDLALAPLPASVTGTVTNASDSSEIEGAEVVVERLENGEVVEQVGSDTTNADGNYTVGGLDAHEDYRVTADAVNFTDNATNVSLGPNETVTRDFQLEPAGHVTGTVLNQSSEPIVGATVTIIEPGGTFGNDQNVTQTTTDVNGEYRTEEIPTGSYEIEFDHPEYAAENRQLDVEQGENVEGAVLSPEA